MFDGKCRYMELTTAYRSTRPIMTEAFKAARVYWKDININVIRSGVPVVHKTFADRKAREEEIVRVIREETLGGGTIAVIERDAERAKALYESLKRNCELRLIEDKLTSFAHAAYVSASADTKGLQFDAVIIPDAGANVYAREPRQARLLYLAITRALHRLYVFSEGEQSALLA